MTIHVAVMHLSEPSPEGETEQVFASLDGEKYLPITRVPEPDDAERIAGLFDGNGTVVPMTYARNALRASWWPESAKVESFDHYTV